MPKGLTYSQEEVDNFLEIVEEILPMSPSAWERIAELHSSRYPDLKRTVDSLKRKFKELHSKKVPTGDPVCPPAVRRAKQLRQMIIEKMDASDLNEPSSEEDEYLGEGPGEEEKEDISDDESSRNLEDDEAASDVNGNKTAASTATTGTSRRSEIDVSGISRPLSRASTTAPRIATSVPPRRSDSLSGFSRTSSLPASSKKRASPTHMAPMGRPRTRQRGNNAPDVTGDRIGNMVAMMMMSQASERDERRNKREQRRVEFLLQMEMQCQQMQQQQNLMTMLLMNSVGMNNQQHRPHQLGFGSASNTQPDNHGQDEKNEDEE